MKIKKQNGFTLFEMLVVISIIAILTTVISASFSSAQKKARDSKRQQDMKAIQTAAEQYYSLAGYNYPADTNAPTSWTSNGQIVLDVFPQDPKGTGWTGYSYPAVAVGSTYCACARMESKSNGNSTTSGCNFGAGVGTTGDFFCVKSQQ